MRASAATVWQVVHSERRQLAADLSGLPDEQWNIASLCPGWDIHDVLAHMVDTALTSRLSFARDLVMARMDFDRANENGIAREKRQDPQDTLSAFREVADFTRTPPANVATRLVEAIVHGEELSTARHRPGALLPTAHPCFFRRRTRACRGLPADRPEYRRHLGEGRRRRGRSSRFAARGLRAPGCPRETRRQRCLPSHRGSRWRVGLA
jgi:uncharacterized protein (TIGR03083 family)